MKTISFLTIVLLLCLAVVAFAFSPNGSKVTTLNVNTVNQNLANDKEYRIDTSTACKVRLKRNSSVANSGVTQISLGANTGNVFAVNRSTPYLNLSGCTGSLTRE